MTAGDGPYQHCLCTTELGIHLAFIFLGGGGGEESGGRELQEETREWVLPLSLESDSVTRTSERILY